MGDSSSHLSIADLSTGIKSAESGGRESKRTSLYLFAETTVLTIAVVLVIRALTESLFANALWFVAPAILVAAALIPTILRRDRFTQIGLSIRQIKFTLSIVSLTCLLVFPAVFAGFWLLRSYGLELPLRVALPQNQPWLSWVLYQFLYVAVAEEVFFRGYLQSNILRLTNTTKWRCGLQNWASIVLSAACFAGAHAIVHGQAISVLTFLPGLILGWLFIRTRSLLAPILFHGMANICYCIMAVVLA